MSVSRHFLLQAPQCPYSVADNVRCGIFEVKVSLPVSQSQKTTYIPNVRGPLQRPGPDVLCVVFDQKDLYVAERNLLVIAKFFVYCDLKRQIPIVVSVYDETLSSSSSSSFYLNQTTRCMQRTHIKKLYKHRKDKVKYNEDNYHVHRTPN